MSRLGPGCIVRPASQCNIVDAATEGAMLLYRSSQLNSSRPDSSRHAIVNAGKSSSTSAINLEHQHPA